MWQYVLSTRHNISICGVNSFDTSNVDSYGRIIIDYEKDIHRIHSTHDNFDSFVKVMSYDIETYTKDNMISSIESHVVMCIGICFFLLSSPIPYRRICLIIKPVETTEEYTKYSKDDNVETEYISYESEKEMLKGYIKLIHDENPLVIVGFNNFGFDDGYIYSRMKLFGLDKTFLELFSYDNTATFKNIELKIDGIQQSSNNTIIGNKIFCVDVYKYMLKANPKLYTQQAKGNLNSMLLLNKIKSPYDNKSYMQKTDLTYSQMFDYWDSNIEIKKIGFYCVNDALCAGLLLIKMGLLQDKIKLGETSCSSLYDSLYREVSEKVLTKIEEFGWKNDFCLSDDIITSRPNPKDFK